MLILQSSLGKARGAPLEDPAELEKQCSNYAATVEIPDDESDDTDVCSVASEDINWADWYSDLEV